MKVAVIGSGISGLGAAWLLRKRCDVTVYEAEARPGGHSNTVEVDGNPVDTGFIVFNQRNYPHLTALLEALDVATEASDMSFAASIDAGRIEYAGDNLNTLFGQRGNLVSPSHWRMLTDILHFNRSAKAWLALPEREPLTLGEYLDRGRFGERFRHAYLLPMGAAIWSCPVGRMLDFPAESFLRFFDNHALLEVSGRPQWRTVSGGSREYVARLAAELGPRLQLACPVRRIASDELGATVVDARGEARHFDQVILATHSDQALRLLANPDPRQAAMLRATAYQANRAILHSDPALMPRNPRVWASWNYLADGPRDSRGRVSVSYWMNRLQNLGGERQYFVTLNPLSEPDPALVHYECEYMHPVFTQAALDWQRQLPRLQGVGHVWFCGAWTGYGFHEDGLRSAVAVANALGVTAPWQIGATLQERA